MITLTQFKIQRIQKRNPVNCAKRFTISAPSGTPADSKAPVSSLPGGELMHDRLAIDLEG